MKKPFFTCLTLICILALSEGREMKAQGPDDAEAIIERAERNRKQQIAEKIDTAMRQLREITPETSVAVYLAAVRSVHFKDSKTADKAFKSWMKVNASLVEDPRMPVALQMAACNLAAQLLTATGRAEEAALSYMTMLAKLKTAPNNIAGFHLMQETLTRSLLVKHLRIDENLLNFAGVFPGSLMELDGGFKAVALPWYEQHRLTQVRDAWELYFAARKKLASFSKHTADKFTTVEQPRIMAEMAESLYKCGQKQAAIDLMKRVLFEYPASTEFASFTTRLEAMVGEKTTAQE